MSARRQRNEAPLADTATPEAELVIAARQGSEMAVRELVRRLNPRLFRVARGIVASDAEAEEVVQETYLAGFSKLDGFRGEARFSTWITRIAINTARMRLRRDRPKEAYDTVTEDNTSQILAFPGQGGEPPETAVARAQIRGFVEAAVAGLPPDLRLTFILRETEGLSTAAIAHQLEISPVTVKTRLFRARLRLRAALEKQVRGGFDAIFPFDGKRCVDMGDRVVAGLTMKGRL
jgi:RNA polymerase sigma-70 factor (ECF subfamily)